MENKKLTDMTPAELRLYTARLDFEIIRGVINGETTVPRGLSKSEYSMYLMSRGMLDLVEYCEIKEKGGR